MTEKLIVLRVIPHKESDLIVHGINHQGSKVVLYARGALRSKKRFGGGVLQPTHYIQVHYRPSSVNPESMLQLQEASLLEDFPGLRESYEKLELALYCVALVDRMSKEGMVHSEGVFHLLGNVLRTIEGSHSLTMLKLHFELKLLASQGELPFIEGADPLLQATVKDHEKVQLDQNVVRSISSALSQILHHY
jgi:DNA repair protein RecO (recombination protein O)